MRNKDQKKKCKGQESTIGKIIYGFLLFLPLLAITTTCLVQTFNQNAKQQEEAQVNITYKYQTNEVNSNDDLIVNNVYLFSWDFTISDNETNQVDIFDESDSGNNVFQLIDFNVNLIPSLSKQFTRYSDFCLISTNVKFQDLVDNTEVPLLSIDDSNDDGTDFTITGYQTRGTYSCYFIFKYLIEGEYFSPFYITNNITSLPNELNPVESVELEQEPLDENVFYRAVDRVTQSPLFNWAQNSIIYTTTNATCNTLSITTPFIPLLMSYWLIISVIYFLYDIALMLVWIIHRKIHELQESI